MKYILPVLISLSMAAVSCQFKQKQFVTTLGIEDSIVTTGQLDTAVMVLKKRLEIEKMKDAAVTVDNTKRQVIIRSGKLEKDWIKTYLLKKGALIFYECYTLPELGNSLAEADKIVTTKLTANKIFADSAANPFLSIFADFATPYTGNGSQDFPGYVGYVEKEKMPLLKKYFAYAKDVFPADAALVFGKYDFPKSKQQFYEVFFVRDNDTKFFASNHVKEAMGKTDGEYASIQMLFDAYGAYVWKRITNANINKTLVIVIDGDVLSAPKVVGAIEDGNTQINGAFEKQEVRNIAKLLQSGYLPLQLQFINTEEARPNK